MSRNTARDYPEMYAELGIDTARLGCIMLDVKPLFDLNMLREEWGYTDPELPFVNGFEPILEKPHVTLLYGLLESGQTWRKHVDEVLADWDQPETIGAWHVDWFSAPGLPYKPVVFSIDAEARGTLRDANSRLQLLPHINTFPEYKPHITIGYVKNEHVDDVLDAVYGYPEDFEFEVVGLNYGR